MQPPPLSRHGRPGDLVLLAAERTVTVTREEHHQDVLSGRAGPAVVELRPCTISAGKHAGHDGLEVALDGRRVGELTRLMAQRYRPTVDEVRARGYRAGCEAVLRDDARGVQVELRLPAVTGRAAGDPRTDRLESPAHGGTPWPPLAPPTAAIPPTVPRQHPWPPATPVSPDSSAPPRRRIPDRLSSTRQQSRRRLLGVTGAVVGVLVVASALGSGSRDEVPTGNSSALPSVAAAPVSPAPVDPDSAPASVAPAAEPSTFAAGPARRSTEQARPPAPTTSRPAPRTVEAAPEPAPEVEPEPEPEPSGCDPNYDPCVPIADDVDCAGGSGDGPAYVDGPVRVIGSDIYDLDRGGEPGIGCE